VNDCIPILAQIKNQGKDFNETLGPGAHAVLQTKDMSKLVQATVNFPNVRQMSFTDDPLDPDKTRERGLEHM